MTGLSGEFFKGLAQIFDVLLKAVSQFQNIKDRKYRREAARDLIAACLVTDEIVRNGKVLLKRAGSNPIRKVTEMAAEERGAYATECQRLIARQFQCLSRFGSLLENVPVIQILDPGLKQELDAIIGTKFEGLMAVAAPLGIYIYFGPIPEQEEVAQYGSAVADLRCQASILALLFAGKETDDQTADIDITSASDNLNQLHTVSERLRTRVTELFSKEEIILLAKQASEHVRAKQSISDRLQSSTGR